MLKALTAADFERNRDAIHELIFETQRPTKPSLAQQNAISNAITLMRKQRQSPHIIAVLAYHVEKPEALIFRDAYTMAALREAHKALNRAIECEERRRQNE